ncbi:hypothetical protein EIK77_003992 [Talaromyces pinophilus]|nr:hypothetical protein EIK77_003992 [Talaromyces pinophilus]
MGPSAKADPIRQTEVEVHKSKNTKEKNLDGTLSGNPILQIGTQAHNLESTKKKNLDIASSLPRWNISPDKEDGGSKGTGGAGSVVLSVKWAYELSKVYLCGSKHVNAVTPYLETGHIF